MTGSLNSVGERTAVIGDRIVFEEKTVTLKYVGRVQDPMNPSAEAWTLTGVNDDGELEFSVIQGPEGRPGRDGQTLDFQLKTNLEDPRDLPSNLGSDDKYKTWIIPVDKRDLSKGAYWFIWTGNSWYKTTGAPSGPPGPVPKITMGTITVYSLDEYNAGAKSSAVISGSSLNPVIDLKLAAPPGPQGPSTRINEAPDFDKGRPPLQYGDTLLWDPIKGKWFGDTPVAKDIMTYSIPPAGFHKGAKFFQSRTVLATYQLPPLPFDYTVRIYGHIRTYAQNLSLDILNLFNGYCEVRMGDPGTSGMLVGKGLGTPMTNIITLQSSVADTSQANLAYHPSNNTGVIKANSSPAANTLYVVLVSTGLFSSFEFDNSDAEVIIDVIPKPNDLMRYLPAQ